MLTIEDLSAGYGEGTVVNSLNLIANQGQVTCLIGRNGAGKTTTLRGIMGLIKSSADTLRLDETDRSNFCRAKDYVARDNEDHHKNHHKNNN